MAGVIADARPTLDHGRDPGQRPQVGLESVRGRAAAQGPIEPRHSAAVNRGFRPARPAPFRPRRPATFQAAYQRQAVIGVTANVRATAASDSPRANRRAAWNPVLLGTIHDRSDSCVRSKTMPRSYPCRRSISDLSEFRFRNWVNAPP